MEWSVGPDHMERIQCFFLPLFSRWSGLAFLVCILGVTQRGAPVELAGIAIGLTLAAIHLVGINISR